MAVTTKTFESNQVRVPERGTNIINVDWPERVVSAGAGGYLLAAGLRNLGRRPIKGLIQTVLGGFFLYRGSSGNCPVYTALGKEEGVHHAESVNIRTSLLVERPRLEVYYFWRQLENLPLFMKHLLTVQQLDTMRSHWEAVLPGNVATIKWDAEIVKEEEGRLLGWKSIPGSTIENAGKVEFRDAGIGATELEVVISYRPPAGELGTAIAKLLNPIFEKVVLDDIRNFKTYIESCEVITYVGQPTV